MLFLFVILTLNSQITIGVDGRNSSSRKSSKYEDFNSVMEELKDLFPVVIDGDGYTEYRTLNESPTKHLGFQANVRNNVPDYFDWRDLKMVSPIKDQGNCAACWAFSAVGALECHLKIHQNLEVFLSEQFLIDCIHDYGYYSHCSSMTVTKTYALITTSQDLGGVLKSEDYRPYDAGYKACRYHGAPPYPVPLMGFVKVHNNEDEMVRQLYLQGPLSAAINSKAMDVYKGNNVIDEPTEEQCSSRREDLDHAVIVVGYNVYVGEGRVVPYWIIKNSWGSKWGSDGYYYLVRGRNACGIANDVCFPVTS